MLSMLIDTRYTHCKPHKDNIRVVNGEGIECGAVAWWSDHPIPDAIAEAKFVVRKYKEYGVSVTRIVLDGNNNEVFRIDGDTIQDPS